VQYNEADVANESYICFRHREIKAVRKTRAQQATPSDKVIRLRAEMTSSIELALMILKREQLKQVAPQFTRSVWQKRLPLLDLKRQYASIGSREDEELLLDKEKPPKKPKNESKYIVFLFQVSQSWLTVLLLKAPAQICKTRRQRSCCAFYAERRDDQTERAHSAH
jgi:enhancer of polycomb-like protein